jgi:hypothetical protein
MLSQIGGESEAQSREKQATHIVLKLVSGLETLLGFASILTTGVLTITTALFTLLGKTANDQVGLIFSVVMLAILLPGLVLESVLLCALTDKLRLGWRVHRDR